MLSSAFHFMKTLMLNRNVEFLLGADVRMHKRKRIMETESRPFSYRRDYSCGWLYLLTKCPYQGYLYFYVDFAHYVSSCMGQEFFLGGQLGDVMGMEIYSKLSKKKKKFNDNFSIPDRFYPDVLEDKIYLNCLPHSASHMLLLHKKAECICDSAWHLLLAL